MNLVETVLAAESPNDQDPGKLLVYSIVATVLVGLMLWTIRRNVTSGKIAPIDRRTSPHSRRYLVVLASLNALVAAFFLVTGPLSIVAGDIALGAGLLLMGAVVATFSWMILRQGSSLRRDGLPDRAPTEAEKKLSRPRRTIGWVVGGASGVIGLGAIGAAYDRDWSAAAVGAVVAVVAFAVSWWLHRPLRSSGS